MENDRKPINTAPSAPADIAAHCPDFAEIVRNSTPDESLFEQIAQCFSERLEEFAKYVCRDETSGKDAFQDAMLAAMTHLNTYRGDSPVDAWLRRIVVTSCTKLRRGKKNDPHLNRPLETREVASALADKKPDQELRLILAERLELVRREIESLDEPNQSLLMLHDVREVTIAELGKQFDMTEEAVKSRLKRSRAKVRSRLLKHI
ncbi:MAG: sigma-70 family RNA polymerase sigma factor [Proteobacteria bacterium]|nr:sigma-70 family RNA polymerase sigma factor [Pseudomonadota bacterium]